MQIAQLLVQNYKYCHTKCSFNVTVKLQSVLLSQGDHQICDIIIFKSCQLAVTLAFDHQNLGSKQTIRTEIEKTGTNYTVLQERWRVILILTKIWSGNDHQSEKVRGKSPSQNHVVVNLLNGRLGMSMEVGGDSDPTNEGTVTPEMRGRCWTVSVVLGRWRKVLCICRDGDR